MDLPTLMAETEMPAAVEAVVHELVALKAVTRELGAGEVPTALRTYIGDSLAEAMTSFEDRVLRDEAATREVAADFFRSAVARFHPS